MMKARILIARYLIWIAQQLDPRFATFMLQSYNAKKTREWINQVYSK